MKDKKATFFQFSIILILFLNSLLKVDATSWIDLEAEEVIEGSEVIVLGTYDLTAPIETSEFIFVGYPFHVTKVFKGETEEIMTVGIDMFDVGWVDDFQSSGVEFLLFLERTDHADFLIPVGGPNGMIRIYNGKISGVSSKERVAFEKVFSGASVPPTDRVQDWDVDKGDGGRPSYTLYIVMISVVVVFFTLLYGYLIFRRKSTK